MESCMLGRRLTGSGRDDDWALAEALVLFAAGRLKLAIKMAAESAFLATQRRDRRRQASARLFGALFFLYLGDFLSADRELTAVVKLLAPEPVDEGSDVPIMHALLAALQVLRGDEAIAERSFEQGIRVARANGDSYREAIVRAARADLLAPSDPHRAEADARFALDVFAAERDDWFTVWASRGEAKAVACSAVEMSLPSLQALCRHVANPLERARTELALGSALITAGRPDEGVRVLRRTARRFRWYEACWFEAQTLAIMCPVLNTMDLNAAKRLGARLQALTDGRDDPAWDVVRMPPHRLVISLLGPRPGAILNGRRLELRPRSLALLAALITSDSTSRRKLQELMWPADFRTWERQKLTSGRLRDTLSELRSALGDSAACRLSNRDDPVEFNVHGADIDYLVGLALEAEAQAADRRGDIDGRSRAAIDALAILDKPFLGTLSASWGWVTEKDDYLQDCVVDRLRRWSQQSGGVSGPTD